MVKTMRSQIPLVDGVVMDDDGDKLSDKLEFVGPIIYD